MDPPKLTLYKTKPQDGNNIPSNTSSTLFSGSFWNKGGASSSFGNPTGQPSIPLGLGTPPSTGPGLFNNNQDNPTAKRETLYDLPLHNPVVQEFAVPKKPGLFPSNMTTDAATKQTPGLFGKAQNPPNLLNFAAPPKVQTSLFGQKREENKQSTPAPELKKDQNPWAQPSPFGFPTKVQDNSANKSASWSTPVLQPPKSTGLAFLNKPDSSQQQQKETQLNKTAKDLFGGSSSGAGTAGIFNNPSALAASASMFNNTPSNNANLFGGLTNKGTPTVGMTSTTATMGTNQTTPTMGITNQTNPTMTSQPQNNPTIFGGNTPTPGNNNIFNNNSSVNPTSNTTIFNNTPTTPAPTTPNLFNNNPSNVPSFLNNPASTTVTPTSTTTVQPTQPSNPPSLNLSTPSTTPKSLFNTNTQSTNPLSQFGQPPTKTNTQQQTKKQYQQFDPDRPIRITNPILKQRILEKQRAAAQAAEAAKANQTATTPTLTVSAPILPTNTPTAPSVTQPSQISALNKSSTISVPETTPLIFPKATTPTISTTFANPPPSSPSFNRQTELPSEPFYQPPPQQPPRIYNQQPQNNRTYSFNQPQQNGMEISQSNSPMESQRDTPPEHIQDERPSPMQLSVSVPINKAATPTQLFRSMIGRPTQHPSQLLAFEILQKICSLSNDQPRLREFVFTIKPIQNFIFLNEAQKTPISFNQFNFPKVPDFSKLPMECKQHLFYLFDFFTLHTALPPQNCMPAFQSFLIKSNYMSKIMNSDNTPNVQYIKSMYDVSYDGQILALRFHSQENYRVQTAILNEYSHRNRLALQCLSIAARHINSNQFAAMIKDSLYKKLWQRYIGMQNRIKEVVTREINPSFIENYLVQQKIQQRLLIKMLAQLIEQFPTIRASNRDMLLQILHFIDNYRPLENDIRLDIIKKYSQDVIQTYHQHCLIFLLELDRLKKPVKKPNVWTEMDKLSVAVLDTSSLCLAPFRDIISTVIRIIYDKEIRQKNIDFRKVLQNVQQPQWASWMEIYILKVQRQIQQQPQKAGEFMRMLMISLKKIYRDPKNVGLVWRARDPQSQSNVLKFLRRLKETQQVKYRFTLASILMGNHQQSHVDNILRQQFFDGSDWQRQIFKGMVGRISDFERSRMMAEPNRLQHYQMEKEQVDAKVVFLTRIFELAPQESDSIEQQMFGRMTDRQGIDRNNGPMKVMFFLMDCLKYYSLDQHIDFRILKHIFRAMNSLISCPNPAISNTLYFVIGVCFNAEPKGNIAAYTHLKFLQKMQKNIGQSQVRKLAIEIKKHVDLLLCNVDIMKLLPEATNYKPQALEAVKSSYNNRYNLTSKQISDMIQKAKANGFYPSTWIRTVMEVVKVGAIDFQFIERLLRKFLFCPSNLMENSPTLLAIIFDAINAVDFVEAAVETLEVVSINPNTTYVRIQSNPFNIENKRYLASSVDGQAIKMAESKKQIQQALKLLHTTMNIALAVSVTNKQTSDIAKNFLVKLLKNSRFFGILDRRFLSKASLYTYRDLTSITNNINFNIVETLFAHVNFQENRGQTLQNNPSQRMLEYHWQLDDHNEWFRHKDYRAQEDLTRLFDAFIKVKSRIDWNLLVNPLELPTSKNYECRQSVSINALRCIGSLLQLWQLMPQAQQISLYDCLIGSQMSSNIFTQIREEFLKILERYRERSLETKLILEILTLSATKHPNFLDLMIQTPDQQGRTLYKFIQNFLASGQKPVIFYKIVNLLAQLFKKRTVVMQQAERKHDVGGICQLLVKKLQEMVRGNQPQYFSSEGFQPSQLFQRHQLQRQYYRFLCVNMAVQKVVWILLGMYLNKQTRVLEALNNLFKFIMAQQLFIPQPNQQNIVKTEEDINRCLLQSCPVFHFRNIIQDALEEYYRNDKLVVGKNDLQSRRIKDYFEIQRRNIIYYYDQVRIRQKFAINKLLLLILSTGRQGYLMSTISMHIDDQKCGRFLCHKHQPKMVDGFSKIISSGNAQQTVETLHNMSIDLLTAMKKYPKSIDYRLATMLLSSNLKAIMGLASYQKEAAKELVNQMLNNLHWLSDDQDFCIRDIRTAQLTTDLLNLHSRLGMTTQLTKITAVIENSLALHNLDKHFRGILLNMVIHFNKKAINPNILLNSIDQDNPILFHHACRVLCQQSRKNSVELCQRGLLDVIFKNKLLSTVTQKTNFYTPQQERNPFNLCWLWTLNVMKCLIMNSDRNHHIFSEVMKILIVFQKRIFRILSAPAVLASQQSQPLSLAFMEELSCTVSLISTLYLDSTIWMQSNRQFYQNVLFFVMHYTIDLYRPDKTMNSIYQAVSETQFKMQSTFHSKSQTFQRQQVNFKEGSHKGVRSDDGYRPNMFIYTIEHLQFDVATGLSVIIARGLPLSLIVQKYFEQPIDRQFGNHYQSLFWNRMNRCLPLLQQYLDFTAAKWNQFDSQLMLTVYREMHQTPQVFMSNGYLSSMILHPQREQLKEMCSFAAVMCCQAAQSYLALQLKFNSRYFSLLLEDLHQFKSLQLQILKSFQQKINTGEWKNMLLTTSAKIDRLRIM